MKAENVRELRECPFYGTDCCQNQEENQGDEFWRSHIKIDGVWEADETESYHVARGSLCPPLRIEEDECWVCACGAILGVNPSEDEKPLSRE